MRIQLLGEVDEGGELGVDRRQVGGVRMVLLAPMRPPSADGIHDLLPLAAEGVVLLRQRRGVARHRFSVCAPRGVRHAAIMPRPARVDTLHVPGHVGGVAAVCGRHPRIIALGETGQEVPLRVVAVDKFTVTLHVLAEGLENVGDPAHVHCKLHLSHLVGVDHAVGGAVNGPPPELAALARGVAASGMVHTLHAAAPAVARRPNRPRPEPHRALRLPILEGPDRVRDIILNAICPLPHSRPPRKRRNAPQSDLRDDAESTNGTRRSIQQIRAVLVDGERGSVRQHKAHPQHKASNIGGACVRAVAACAHESRHRLSVNHWKVPEGQPGFIHGMQEFLHTHPALHCDTQVALAAVAHLQSPVQLKNTHHLCHAIVACCNTRK
mmetsp:Transcript_10548/g.27934  ORF Transcript_10548/g.27934 Transcript_10548/m.27934 type:complete len:381 (+) Transcript_10548:207-1349(+)